MAEREIKFEGRVKNTVQEKVVENLKTKTRAGRENENVKIIGK